jgi:hypothetical protein
MSENEITKIKTMFCVVNPGQERDLIGVLTEHGAFGFYEFRVEGIAKPDVLSLLGLTDNKRILIVCLARAEDVGAIRAALEERVYTKPGSGIAFVVGVDGFIGARTLYRLARDAENNDNSLKEKK